MWMRCLFAASALLALPAMACEQPAEWAKQFQNNSPEFYAGAPDAALLKQVTPELGALLKQEAAYADGEIGHLDYDPWLGAQDGSMQVPRFEVESETADLAIVALRFQFDAGDGNSVEKRVAHLILRKETDACWRLADLITPYGESLAYLYSQP